jgi:hypothetical protein
MPRHPEQSIYTPYECKSKEEFYGGRVFCTRKPISLEVVTRPFYLEHGKKGVKTLVGHSYVLVHRLYTGNEQGKSHVEAYYQEWLSSAKFDSNADNMTSRIEVRNKALLQIPERLRELREAYPGRNIFAVGGQEELAEYIQDFGGRMLVDFSLEEKGCAVHKKTLERLVAPPVDNSPASEAPTRTPAPIEVLAQELAVRMLSVTGK